MCAQHIGRGSFCLNCTYTLHIPFIQSTKRSFDFPSERQSHPTKPYSRPLMFPMAPNLLSPFRAIIVPLMLLLAVAGASKTSAASQDLPNFQLVHAPNHQKPILNPPSTLPTSLSTTTRTTHYVVETQTLTRTRYIADGATNVPSAVKTWYKDMDAKDVGCDWEACKGCRAWYGCGGLETTW